MARSAEVAAPTVTMAVAELFARFGSFVPEVTLATSTIWVPLVVAAPTLTVIVNVELARLATNAFVQVIFPVAPTAGVKHVQPAGVTMAWKVVLAGTASVKIAFTAAIGPRF